MLLPSLPASLHLQPSSSVAPAATRRASSRTQARRRYVLCGASHRALSCFISALQGTHRNHGEIVGVLEPDAMRLAQAREMHPALKGVPAAGAEDLGALLRATQPDALLVMSPDHCHAAAVLAALPQGIDCIVEKPLATTSTDLNAIMAAVSKGPGKLLVTHNLRFSPLHQRIADLLRGGAVGRPTLVELQWSIDVTHGSSYFQRWHRQRQCSGGLAVHKSSHHFDLVAYWLGCEPEHVYAQGSRQHFGPGGAHDPINAQTQSCSSCAHTHSCTVHQESEHWRRVAGQCASSGHRHARSYSSLAMDTCVFAAGTDLRDSYACTINFTGGVLLQYSAQFAAPYSGFRLCVSGTRGRLEVQHRIATQRLRYPAPATSIDLFPLFGGHQMIDVPDCVGGHDGGDAALLNAVFPLEHGARDPRLATAHDGVRSVAIGLAVERSIDLGRPVAMSEILPECASGAPASVSAERA